MPRGDRTGPDGRGPMTGRAMGYCAGNDRPGYAEPGFRGRGLGRGFGRGLGFGRGFGWRAFAPQYAEPVEMTKDQKLKVLEAEQKEIEAELSDIKKEIQALRK